MAVSKRLQVIGSFGGDKLPAPASAEVGQVIKVSAVDENGVPTATEAADGVAAPDWEQNDSTAADYIKNRPFYAEEGEVALLSLEGEEFTYSSEDGGYITAGTPTAEQLNNWYGDWEECTVIWDGVSYPVPAQYYVSGMKCVGDIDLMLGAGSTGEPFIIMMADAATFGEDVYAIYSLTEATPEDTENAPTYTHDVSVIVNGEIVHPLAPKFIESVPWKKVTDRPFGYWAPGELKLVDNQSVTMEEYTSREGCVLARMKAIDFVEGASYTVTWCGTKYTCTAVSANPYTYVGNPYWAGGNTDDAGEPFFIGYQWDFGQTFVWASADNVAAGETAEFTIANAEEYVKTIEEKYLPEDTPELPTVTTDDDGKFLRVVEGAWAAMSVSNAEEASF